jgi:hypothetical protein
MEPLPLHHTPAAALATRRLMRRLAAGLAGALLSVSGIALAAGCRMPTQTHDATSADIRAFAEGQGRQIFTFAGFSGTGYEDEAAMRAHAERVLQAQDPARVMVNVGATAEGIGAVYELAKRRGFTTLGIVSSRAREQQVPLSPCVDHVFFVRDSSWGGQREDGGGLSPTSAAIVENSAAFVAIGGGDIARDEALAARRAGKPVSFIPADMNHEAARKKAREKGEPEPTDFKGSAHEALVDR